MTPNALLEEILRLPPDERLRLVERVWDSLAVSPDGIPVPQWHKDELDLRLDNPSDEPSLSREDLQARLRPPG